MPIYAYRCAQCGHAKDVLQKLSDPLLTTCPACGAEAFSKQVTAAGFQLKGSGWYVTDFRDGGKPAAKTEPAVADAPGDAGAKPEAKPDAAADAKPAAATPAAAETKSADSKPAASAPAAAPSTPASGT